MVKRKRTENEREPQKLVSLTPHKRLRIPGKNVYDDLSDELVLRILSFLPIHDLITSELVSKRFRRLAADNEIWREKFYNRFVRPRARRLPALAGHLTKHENAESLHYSSTSARWLEYSERLHKERDWKRRYKIKFNWTQGRCMANDVALKGQVKPQILVKVHRGVIFTADDKCMQSYSQRMKPQLLNTHYWEIESRVPTAMDVSSRDNDTLVSIGFETGDLELYVFGTTREFEYHSHYRLHQNKPISNLALRWPYVLVMSDHMAIDLYQLPSNADRSTAQHEVSKLAQLQSNMVLLPVSLSLRKATSILVASVAYAFSRLNAGWALGIQEVRVNLSGNVIGSRLTSTIDTPLIDFPLRRPAKIISRSAASAPLPLHPQLMHPPNSLSHSGCYILAGLPDNTLMVYTVTSSEEKLEINAGRRLWGHTSAVACTEVSERGKALSISAKGDEVRVWELEDILSSHSLQKTSTELKPRWDSDSLQVAMVKRGAGLGLALSDMKNELTWVRRWVGFDDEQVVVLSQHDQNQRLSCYDFA